ncbi:MAG: histidine phosphatase family protein [Clostridia bacterium]|nr:histidine phosphatase family protein [Clostridia bacterium]
MTTVYLIRHGQVENNITGILNGNRSDQALNDTGVTQAKALAPYFAGKKIDYILASSMLRAHQTAALTFGKEMNEIDATDDLREIDFGKYDGMPYNEVQQNPLWFHEGIGQGYPGGGESWEGVKQRACRALLRAIEGHRDGAIALVSHGMCLSLLLMAIFDLTNDQYANICAQSNTGVHRLSVGDEGTVTVEEWNYDAHLAPFHAQIKDCPGLATVRRTASCGSLEHARQWAVGKK